MVTLSTLKTVVVLSSTRELLGTPPVLPALPFGQIKNAFEPAFATVSVSVAPAGMLRNVPLLSVKLDRVGTVVLLFGFTDRVCETLSPPALEVSVTVTLRAPLPPF